MANQEHRYILIQGVEPWNQWREKNTMIRHPDLEGAYLKKANLSGANLSGANLSYYDRLPSDDQYGIYIDRTDLSGASLKATNFSGADLNYADLSGADLSGADLSGANLSGTDLSGTDLSGANLSGAIFSVTQLNPSTEYVPNFRRANFSGANLSNSYLAGADLSGVNLSRSDLSYANLSGAILNGADLSGANLTGTKLENKALRKTRLRGANLNGRNLNNMDFSRMDLSGVNLNETSLIKTNFKHANLSNCSIYGIAAWDILIDKLTIQKSLIITPPGQPKITVDNLKIAQFIYLLLNNAEIRDVIDTLTTKAVLILGRFTRKRIVVLDALREALREHGYVPILFDFKKPSSRNLTETVSTLAHIARFIIADLTNPSSIPQELQAIVPTLAIPIQPVLLERKREYSMFVDLSKNYHWVLSIHFYKDQADLIAALEKEIIEPAEKKAEELEKR